jgi:hypothetical protein
MTSEILKLCFECGCEYIKRPCQSCAFVPCQKHDELIQKFDEVTEKAKLEQAVKP